MHKWQTCQMASPLVFDTWEFKVQYVTFCAWWYIDNLLNHNCLALARLLSYDCERTVFLEGLVY